MVKLFRRTMVSVNWRMWSNLSGACNLSDKLMLCFFVVCLRRIAQQPANVFYTVSCICLFYFEDCWEPGFLLMLMSSCFSAIFIIVSSASPRSFSHASCFSAVQFFAAILFEYPAHPQKLFQVCCSYL